MAYKQRAKRPVEDRFFEKIELIPFHSCWEWIGSKSLGYGKFTVAKNKIRWAHRVSYEIKNGPIKKGLFIDHLCMNKACVNPNHLEAVTCAVNSQRAAQVYRKDFCGKGHEFNKTNTYIRTDGNRDCRACKNLSSKRRGLLFINREKRRLLQKKRRRIRRENRVKINHHI